HEHAWGTGLFISIDEITAENRRDAQNPKRVGRDIAAAKSLRGCPIVAQVHRAGHVGRQSYERSRLLAPSYADQRTTRPRWDRADWNPKDHAPAAVRGCPANESPIATGVRSPAGPGGTRH